MARSYVVNTIVEHWLELKTHFACIVKKEKCYTARVLNDMFNDDSNYLYLIIIQIILQECNHLSLIFQNNFIDIGKSYDDICALYMFLARKIMKTSINKTDFSNIRQNIHNINAYELPSKCDFGINYHQTINSLPIGSDDKNTIEYKAQLFIKSLLFELVKRLPDNLELFRQLKLFSPKQCLNQLHTTINNLPFIHQFLEKSIFPKIEVQWKKILNITWSSYMTEKELDNSYTFWTKLYFFKDAGGSFFFRELSEFVLKVLCLPSSNAVVERVFSIMNAIKTKSRNKINFEMLDSLLRIRGNCTSSETCCTKFSPSKSMFLKFNSNIMYLKVKEKETTSKEKLTTSNSEDGTHYDDEDLSEIFHEIALNDIYQ